MSQCEVITRDELEAAAIDILAVLFPVLTPESGERIPTARGMKTHGGLVNLIVEEIRSRAS